MYNTKTNKVEAIASFKEVEVSIKIQPDLIQKNLIL